MNITPDEVIQEFQRQFPKEFTIVVQAIQIAKLQEQAQSNSAAANVEEA
jgi:hypothetical protein